MSAKAEDNNVAPVKKKFGREERLVLPAGQRASKYYPAEDVSQPKKVCAIFVGSEKK